MTWQRVAAWRETAQVFGANDGADARVIPYAAYWRGAAWTLRCEGLNRYDLRRVMRAYDAAYRKHAKKAR